MMARIGCLIYLQRQIPKYNHVCTSMLINLSFYYTCVTAITTEDQDYKIIEQNGVVKLKIISNMRYTERMVCFGEDTLDISYYDDSIRVFAVINGCTRLSCKLTDLSCDRTALFAIARL